MPMGIIKSESPEERFHKVIESLSEQLGAARNEIVSLSEQLGEAHKTLQGLTKELNEANDTVEELNGQLTDARTALRIVQTNLDLEIDEKVALLAQLYVAEESQRKLDVDFQNMKAQCEALQVQLDHQALELNAAQSSVDGAPQAEPIEQPSDEDESLFGGLFTDA